MYVENETFEKLLKLINEKSYNAEKMVLSLARTHPELFVHLAEEFQAQVPLWHSEVIKNIETGNYIPAIKTVREKTQCGLKEAKDVVDNVRYYMNLHYNLTSKPECVNYMHVSMISLYDDLIRAADKLYS